MTALTAEQLAILEKLGATPPPRQGDATAVVVEPRARRRASLLALVHRPSRVAQLERLLDRHRWANAGLRDRLAELLDERDHAAASRDAYLDALETIANVIDEQARTLGHAHPVITGVRAAIHKVA